MIQEKEKIPNQCAEVAQDRSHLRKFCAFGRRICGKRADYCLGMLAAQRLAQQLDPNAGPQTLTKRKGAPEVISDDMKTFNQLLLMAGMATVLTFSTGKVAA